MRTLRRNRVAMAALLVLLAVVALCLLAPVYEHQVAHTVERLIMVKARAIDAPRRKKRHHALARFPPKEWSGHFHPVSPFRQHDGRIARFPAGNDLGVFNLTIAIRVWILSRQAMERRIYNHSVEINVGFCNFHRGSLNADR